MTRSIRHKGLKRFYEDDVPRGVLAEHVQQIRDILARLDSARTVADLDLRGLHIHPLKRELKGLWAVTVRANWRVLFRFEGTNAFDLGYLDYPSAAAPKAG